MSIEQFNKRRQYINTVTDSSFKKELTDRISDRKFWDYVTSKTK